ncbi:MAG: TRAP transporter small permease [Caldimonas sp.]
MNGRPARWLEYALGAVSATVLFAMMLVTATDVAGRYLFNTPLPGGLELTEMMLASLIYSGLPLVSLGRGHIVIDTLDPFFPRPFKRALDIVADLACFLTLAGIGWLIFRRALRVAEYGDTTSVLKLPLAPVAWLMGAMIVVTALIHLALIFVPHAEPARVDGH